MEQDRLTSKQGKQLSQKERTDLYGCFCGSDGESRCKKHDRAGRHHSSHERRNRTCQNLKRNILSRLFDVGIAEEHAVSFAAGLALGGMIPVVAIYSSFLQRAVDQMMHDVCMQNLHVIFAIDRAGLVGADGETHQGCFDLSYLTMMPNMTVMAPKECNGNFRKMLEFAVHAPVDRVAIRYPRGGAYLGLEEFESPIQYGRSEVLYRGEDLAVISVGSMTEDL